MPYRLSPPMPMCNSDVPVNNITTPSHLPLSSDTPTNSFDPPPHEVSDARCFRWPLALPALCVHGTADERAAYFSGLRAQFHAHLRSNMPQAHHFLESIPDLGHHNCTHNAPEGLHHHKHACTLFELMTIRAFHSKLLRRFSLGTAIGFRSRNGDLTDLPAILVFVAHKVHKQWLQQCQVLPTVLEGPGGLWCDVDVVEFSYYGTSPIGMPKEQLHTELVQGLQGNNTRIGPGSQVASQDTYGTLGAIVQSKIGTRQIGFLTNRRVALDLDYPNQKMYHPLPPNIGPGIYIGAVERATSFITDNLWYGVFASMNPETYVRADGAFIAFDECFDMSRVTTTVKGVGDMGEVMGIDLEAPVGSIVGRQVVKVGRSSGITKGRVMAYALEYEDEKGLCFFTDFVIVGENKRAFDLEGDSGSLILLTEETSQSPRPVGMIWGGALGNRGRLKLCIGHGPESWTSGVDLARLLDLLQLSLITSNADLAVACQERGHHRVSGCVVTNSHEVVPYQRLVAPSQGLVKNSDSMDSENELGESMCETDFGFVHKNDENKHLVTIFIDVIDNGSKEAFTYKTSVDDITKGPSASRTYKDVEEFSMGLQLSSIGMQRRETND